MGIFDMDFVQYRELIKSVKQGKKLPTAIYLHASAIDEVLPDIDSIETMGEY